MKSGLKTYLCMAATGLSLFSVSHTAMATCSADSPYIGSVCFTAASFCPSGYLDADGRLLQVSQNVALASLLGTQYGGTAGQTFNLPDLRGRSPVGQGQGPGLTNVLQGIPADGIPLGKEKVVLTIAEMPIHNHLATFSPAPDSAGPVVIKATTDKGTSNEPTATANQLAVPDKPAALIYAAPGAANTQVSLAGVSGGRTNFGGTVAVNNTGESKPFSIIPPQTSLRACIALNGIYPPRP
ncbi:tail fiber protein [Pectobacterium brasiliense]|uniref:Tail fiber protein n=1 Tax=Pectobacterium brasiliense TaxID=180957 RepID=A0AAW9H955_9GAMM|nr:tail fiber protein [Pectobacterium brasiliense]MDY4380604.1 tail fiber protein [Pectobacterium brasiliense]